MADSPRYAGASLEISPTVIEVGTVEGTIDLQFISEVYRVEDDRPGSFDIHCKAADDTETVLRIVHDPDAGTLVFRNQPGVVWWRQPGRR